MADSGFGTLCDFGSGFVGEIIDVGWEGMSRAAIETTHNATSPAKKTFRPSDLVDMGELRLTINFDPDDDPPIDAAAATVIVTWPVPDGLTTGATWQASAFMTGLSITSQQEDRMTAQVTLKYSGDITVTAAT